MPGKAHTLAPGGDAAETASRCTPVTAAVDAIGRLCVAPGTHVLPVPYISQWSPTAQHAPGDCGPTCVTMVIEYLTHNAPTVDAVSIAGDVPKGAHWSSLTQLARAAQRYGLKAQHVRPLTRERIIKEIDAGFPALALVKYDLLATPDDPNQDAKYTSAHFVLIVGYSPTAVIFHDPNQLSGEKFGPFREKPWDVFLNAMGHTSKTPGNQFDNHGMTFNV